MTPQRPSELFAQERPLRSDFARTSVAREKSYARRRFATVFVLLVVCASCAYAVWGRGPSRPGEIPTIKSEGIYKQKPTDPGGIDIPHQDVRVYDELENKGVPTSQVEHLLPPPEVPQQVPHTAAPVTGFSKQMVVPPVGTPQAQETTANVSMAASKLADGEALAFGPSTTKTVATTVAPTPAPAQALEAIAEKDPPEPIPATAPVQTRVTGPAPAPPKMQTLSIDQVIANTKAISLGSSSTSGTPSQAAPAPVAMTAPASLVPLPAASKATTQSAMSGSSIIQLASTTDEKGAQAMMNALQQKYAKDLDGVTLHLARADLGSRGVFYRIQGQGLDENTANRICSALKQQNAGCILVRK